MEKSVTIMSEEKAMPIFFIVIGAIVFLILLWFIIAYNSLIRLRNQIDNVYGSIDAMLKKRYDLIPNLVATCKEYMTHEKELLTEITRLRNEAISQTEEKGTGNQQTNKQDSSTKSWNPNPDRRIQIESELSKKLGALRITMENYPDLKANQNFLQLQGAMNEVEEQISAARRAYNSAVTDYNNAVESFPTSIVASMMSYKQKQVFEISEVERQNPNVKNLFKEE